MQKRLFLNTLILISVTVFFLSLLSNVMVRNLVAQRQSESEIISFQQANQSCQKIFLSAEGTIDMLYRDARVGSTLTSTFNRDDSLQMLHFFNQIESAVNSILIDHDRIDSLVFLGRNGFSCIYTQKDMLYDTRILSAFVSLDELADKPMLKQSLGTSNYPTFFKRSGSEKASGIETQIEDMLNQKIILARKLVNNAGVMDGIIIATIKKDVLSNIIPPNRYDRTLYLTDEQGSMIWSNAPTTIETDSFLRRTTQHKDTWSGKVSFDGEENLVSKSVLSPTSFCVVGKTPIRSYFRQNSFLLQVTMLFAAGAIFLAFISSWFFSRHSVLKIGIMAAHLANNQSSLPEKMTMLPESSWEKRTTLRQRLYLHFGISIIIPVVLFGLLLIFVDYRVYKEKIIEFAQDSATQLRWSIEADIQTWDYLTKRTVFDSYLQSSLSDKFSKVEQNVQREKITGILLDGKQLRQELLSYTLYDQQGNSIVSNLPFNTFSATTLYPNFFGIMTPSSGELEYLGTNRNFLGFGSCLLFARKIRSMGNSFGSLLGFLVISVDQNAMLSRSRRIGLSDSETFEILDSGSINNDQDGMREVRSEKGKSIVFVSTLFPGDKKSSIQLKLIETLPLSSVTVKVWPMATMELTILIFALVFCALASILISRRLRRPLKTLEGLMNDIRNENFDVRMQYSGNDEVAILARSFNRMVDRLNQLVNENYRAQIEKGKLLLLEKEAQFNALQQQINPHFLYNTLDSIQWMAYKAGATDISKMSTALGKFFRSVVHTSKGLVTVCEELELLDYYLAIQKIRYQGKLNVIIDANPALNKMMTLKLLLQPLVENALTHGIEPLRDGGTLTIQVENRNGSLCFTVRDDGVGMTAKRLEEVVITLNESKECRDDRITRATSIGLVNVAQRLQLHFGQEGHLSIESEIGKGTVITVTHPIA